MTYLMVDQVDDFVESVLHKYETVKWQDISMELQEYLFASRLFGKAGAETMDGDLLQWRLQIDNNDTFKITGLYADDSTVRKDLLTHGEMKWSMATANYTYDITEAVFRSSKTKIIEYMDMLEHSLYNIYFKNMELLMFGAGPTSITQAPRPPASLPWWIQDYNGNSSELSTTVAILTAGSATSSAFCGMSPDGFESTGPGSVSPTTYSGWRNRCGVYTVFSQADAINTIVECMDKCNFKAPHAYPELAPAASKFELLTTYSRIKAARDILQSSNDNLGSSLTTYKDSWPIIRGVAMLPVWAWSNQEFGAARTDGPIMGVNWDTIKFAHAAGLKMVKRPPYQDKNKHNVRWRVLDDSNQLYCLNRKANFMVTCTATVTEAS